MITHRVVCLLLSLSKHPWLCEIVLCCAPSTFCPSACGFLIHLSCLGLSFTALATFPYEIPTVCILFLLSCLLLVLVFSGHQSLLSSLFCTEMTLKQGQHPWTFRILTPWWNHSSRCYIHPSHLRNFSSSISEQMGPKIDSETIILKTERECIFCRSPGIKHRGNITHEKHTLGKDAPFFYTVELSRTCFL